ncbi:hypothetical protein KHA80_22200 [Anaerobacillus sp. HL2]|nr:hypothetical protein KHA80_22200 [Anaerobacillus sp. HL2]
MDNRITYYFFFLKCSALSVSAQYKKIPTAGIAINGKVVDGIDPITVDGVYYLPLVKLAKNFRI